MTRIVLHIDKLVLRGVDRSDASALSNAIQAELAQILGAQANAAPLVAQGNRGRMQAGKVKASAGPQATGRAIATRIAGGGR